MALRNWSLGIWLQWICYKITLYYKNIPGPPKVVQNLSVNARDARDKGLILELGRSRGVGNSRLL